MENMEHDGKKLDSLSDQPVAPRPSRQGWGQLTAKYLNDLPRQVGQIRGDLEVRDYAKVKKGAHRIRGTSGTYHLETISQGAERLERCAMDADADNVATAIDEILRQIELETKRLNSEKSENG